ncbi:hypothetical protein B188_13320 [Candidatus Brocadiaceae bacterium B188]|jgi:hypothetical protein|nr:DUF721 domain-containing protein [Candidatus Brocadia sapporoensis]OQZ01295.1 MAG: hypothetical protein B6D34_13780 [Candidatus Brocadia sp. UTAMX1]QQR66408.1 MAG: DUF721 domain-containing protein [Candidatus Brocadia sp.]RZV58721.1 MAG: DUF721 domain-containing protein [Candidatus Brocadia sp. BROELEC01]TWU53365.1 hypothetical protein B188_13320 [Candidatus Brocadiaceae bacterium B188]
MGDLPERFFFDKRGVVSVGQVLKGLFPKRGNGDKLCQEVRNVWKDIVGDEIYRCTEVIDLKKGVLFVNVESTALIHHLTNFEKAAIIAKVNKLTRVEYLSDIRFKVGILNDGRRK